MPTRSLLSGIDMAKQEVSEEIKLLRGILLALLAADRRTHKELLLSQAGFTNVEIGSMVGKTPNAVQKAIQRAKLKGAEADNEG
jgi:hypothetical protein